MFLNHISEGKLERALSTVLLENPFPGTCGRVCSHPCEMSCNRGRYDEAVSIAALERHVFDATLSTRMEVLPASETGRSVAIVGSGLAGLSCAYFLRMLGHRVTVFEARAEAGGVLRYGIPQYRLPKDVVDQEIARIVDLGVELKTGVTLGKAVSYEALKQEYDAVFLAPGACRSVVPGIDGSKLPGVTTGTAFLEGVASNGWRERPRSVPSLAEETLRSMPPGPQFAWAPSSP